MRYEIDLNPITAEYEFRKTQQFGDEYRIVIYLYDKVVITQDWRSYTIIDGDELDRVRREYTEKYQDFLHKRFREYMGYEW